MLTETKVSGQLGSLYGLMAEFDDPESLLEAAAPRARAKAIATWTPILPCRWRAWPRRSASAATGCSAWCS